MLVSRQNLLILAGTNLGQRRLLSHCEAMMGQAGTLNVQVTFSLLEKH